MALDEPDGVTGITAIKQTQPTLTEQIVAFESIGNVNFFFIFDIFSFFGDSYHACVMHRQQLCN